MSRITVDDIQAHLNGYGLHFTGESYKNLDTPIEVQCDKGHRFKETFRKLRQTPLCPVCANSPFDETISHIKKKKNGFRLLAFDQATVTTGWALFEGPELIGHGILTVNEKHDTVTRISMMNQEVIRKIKECDPDMILYEDIQAQDLSAKSGTNFDSIGILTFKTLSELLGVVRNTAHDAGIEFRIVPSSTWRAATGVKGRYRADKKRSAQLIVKQLYGQLMVNDESDAILLGKYGVDSLRPRPEMINWE